MRAENLYQRRAFRLALSPLLAPASLVYAAALAWDRSRKSARRRCLPAPVISIGNLTVGGTGKTPVLLRLLSDLGRRGLRAAVLTRGYNGAGVTRREGCLVPGGDPSGFSDEVRMIAEMFPDVVVGVGADRSAAANAVLRHGVVDLFVLDDGFQHWSLARNLDVVCVDVSRPIDHFLLPLGLLREPLSGLSRADLVLLTRCELAAAESIREAESLIRANAPSARILRTHFDLTLVEPDGRQPSSGTLGGPAIAMSGIGNPAAFEAALTRMGFDVHAIRFPDHHGYGPGDLASVESAARRLGAPVVVTEKDWVKLKATAWARRESRPPLRIAAQKLRFLPEGEPVWTRAIDETVRTNS